MSEKTNDKLIELISEINEKNILVKYDLEYDKYKIDENIEEAIRNKVRYEQDKIKNIYESYANWNYNNEKELYSIEYYYKSGNLQRIFEIIDERDFIYNEELNSELVEKIIYAADDNLKFKFPIGYLKLIYINMKKFEFNKANKILNDFEILFKGNNGTKDKEKILNEIYVLQAIVNFENNNLRNSKIQQRAEYKNKSEVVNLKNGFILGRNNILYFLHDTKGKLYDNLKDNIDRLMSLNRFTNECEYGIEHLLMAEYYIEIGDFAQAENYAYKSLYKAKLKKSKSIIISAYFILMRMYAYSNNINKLNDTLNLFKEESFEQEIYYKQSLEAEFYIDQIKNDKNKEFKVIEKDVLKSNWTNCVSMCKYFINNNEFLKLEVYVEYILNESIKSNNIFGLIYADIFEAILQKYFYKDEIKSNERFMSAVELAKEDNIITPFLENYKYIKDIIQNNKNKNTYINNIISYIDKYIDYKKDEFVELTRREVEVMTLLSEGFKQNEISEELHIALTTVKKHVSSVYDKLGIRNKTKVINILKENNII